MIRKLLAVAAVSAAISVSPAVAQQAQQSQGQSGTMKWKQETTTSQGSQLYLSTASVRQIQQALNSQGFDSGKIDGQWDSETRQAAQKYQKSKGLEPTGTLTIELINSLGMSGVLQGQGGQQQEKGQQGMTWSQETAQGQGTPIYVSTAGVRQVQQALNQKGYDVGAVDGVWGQGTSQAAGRFQQSQGLEPNGKLDVNLISALGLSQQLLQGGQSGQQQGQGQMTWSQERAQGEGTPLWLSPATVREVQQALNKNGFQAGAVDGGWGNQTSQAAQRYQKSKGLEPTGSLTTQLLGSLGISWMGQGQGGRTAQQGSQGQQQSGTSGQGQQQFGATGQQSGGQQGQGMQQQGQRSAQTGQQTGGQQGQQQARQVMTSLDKNGDERIDAMESLENAQLSAEFQNVDRDRNGAVDQQELQAWDGLDSAAGQT